MAITAGPDGNLWFTEILGKQIGRITPDGSITEFPLGGPPSSDPNYITAGPDGNLWFTEDTALPNGNQIGRITPDGSITEWPVRTPNCRPMEITAGPDGNLWFTEYYGMQIGQFIDDGAGPSGAAALAPLLARTQQSASPFQEQRQPGRAAVETLLAGGHPVPTDPADLRTAAKADAPSSGPVHHRADSVEWWESFDFSGEAKGERQPGSMLVASYS
jgi:hypothetical protein